ncbi:MAG: DNA polymerase IV [Thaumarchaeota archaeon]|nr:DNA polymerase IV [Nitrososphaerota archaeon]MDE1831031.1 DNA polymerase IV [Nitrososphaerota archaeon]MDE1840652.1 DNA polymerase IV [Nitrososphaerota archaeon]MDE1877757.1 DNA polymerase IV [Nitrososphaerota archaeon]
MDNRVIFHIDFDYFYAQCEEIRRPDLKTKPVVVCVYSDRGGDSGAVATANYLAREYGVKSGMPIKFAKKKLVDISESVFLPTDFEYYSEVSENAMNIIRNHADIFEYVGRDEAYLDVTNRTSHNFKNAAHLAQQLKNSLRSTIKLSSTIGISSNKLVSKIASGYKKPDGLTIIEPQEIESFLGPLPIRTIPGIGKKSEEKLSEMNLETISQLHNVDVFTLNGLFGRKIGSYIYNAARGIDEESVSPRHDPIQYSRIVTLKQDSKDFGYLANDLEKLCDDLYKTIVRDNILFRSVGIQFVQSDLSNRTKSRTLRNPTSSLDELKKTAIQLLRESIEDQKLPVRRLGVRVSDFSRISGQIDITRFF